MSNSGADRHFHGLRHKRKNIPLSIKCLIVLFFQLRGNVLLAAHSPFVLTRSITSGCGWICRVWFLHELRFLNQSELAKIAFKRSKAIHRCPAVVWVGSTCWSTWKSAAAVEAVFGLAAPGSSLMREGGRHPRSREQPAARLAQLLAYKPAAFSCAVTFKWSV